MVIRFTIHGEPATAGSKRAFPHKRVDGSLGVRVVPDNPRLKSWMHNVAAAACEAYHGVLLTGPIELRIRFGRPRPASHYGTGRNAGKLKANAPKYPATRPDLTKLVRAVEDALTGVVWRDDSQVVLQKTWKLWSRRGYKTIIEISTLD